MNQRYGQPLETQYTIRRWQLNTFGPTTNYMRTATRMNEEVAELLTAISLKDINKIGNEIADIFIVLCGVASEHCFDIAAEEVDKKMKINRERKWNITDEGHGYHVKES